MAGILIQRALSPRAPALSFPFPADQNTRSEPQTILQLFPNQVYRHALETGRVGMIRPKRACAFLPWAASLAMQVFGMLNDRDISGTLQRLIRLVAPSAALRRGAPGTDGGHAEEHNSGRPNSTGYVTCRSIHTHIRSCSANNFGGLAESFPKKSSQLFGAQWRAMASTVLRSS